MSGSHEEWEQRIDGLIDETVQSMTAVGDVERRTAHAKAAIERRPRAATWSAGRLGWRRLGWGGLGWAAGSVAVAALMLWVAMGRPDESLVPRGEVPSQVAVGPRSRSADYLLPSEPITGSPRPSQPPPPVRGSRAQQGASTRAPADTARAAAAARERFLRYLRTVEQLPPEVLARAQPSDAPVSEIEPLATKELEIEPLESQTEDPGSQGLLPRSER